MAFHTRAFVNSKLKTMSLCNVDLSQTTVLQSCDICVKARQPRLQLPYNSIHYTAKFQLVYIKFWGPYQVPTYSKYKYLITLVDDFSRAAWTHLLSCKSNAFNIIKNFLAKVQT